MLGTIIINKCYTGRYYNNCSCSWGGEGPDTLNAGNWPSRGVRCCCCLLVLGWQRVVMRGCGCDDIGDNCCNGSDCCLFILLLLLLMSWCLLLLSTYSAASLIVHSCSSIGGLWCSSVDQSLEDNFR